MPAASSARSCRAGISSVERGQAEAARSDRHDGAPDPRLGSCSRRPCGRSCPPLTNELVNLIKGSALLSVISVYELTRAGQAINLDPFRAVRDLRPCWRSTTMS